MQELRTKGLPVRAMRLPHHGSPAEPLPPVGTGGHNRKGGRDLPRPLGPLLQLEKRVGRCLWEAALVPKAPGRRGVSSLKAEQGDEVTKDLAASLARHLHSSDHVEVVE